MIAPKICGHHGRHTDAHRRVQCGGHERIACVLRALGDGEAGGDGQAAGVSASSACSTTRASSGRRSASPRRLDEARDGDRGRR